MIQCTIEGCSNKHVAKGLCNKHRMAARKVHSTNPPGRPKAWTEKDAEFALYLLEGGASYHEVARSTPIPRTTLVEKFPGYGWTIREGRAFIGWLAADDKRQALYYEMNGIERSDQVY